MSTFYGEELSLNIVRSINVTLTEAIQITKYVFIQCNSNKFMYLFNGQFLTNLKVTMTIQYSPSPQGRVRLHCHL